MQIINHMYVNLEYSFDEIDSHLKGVVDKEDFLEVLDTISVIPQKDYIMDMAVHVCTDEKKLNSALVVSRLKLEVEA